MRHWEQYQAKRLALLKSDVVLVEIDPHQHIFPVVVGLPYYQLTEMNLEAAQEGAFPYYVAVSSGRPAPEAPNGWTQVCGFHVNQNIPKVTIPLPRNPDFTFSFQAAFDQTFDDHQPIYEPDYTRLPTNLNTYSERDRREIVALSQSITILRQQGKSLSADSRPIPLLMAPDSDEVSVILGLPTYISGPLKYDTIDRNDQDNPPCVELDL